MSTDLVVMADTHQHHEKLSVPDGDILIHAGDFTHFGEGRDDFIEWFVSQPHDQKVLVLGNHESMGMTRFAREEFEQSLTHREDLTYVGVTPQDVGPFRIGSDTEAPMDIMVTHYQPEGVLDNGKGDVLIRQTVDRVKPQLHVFGHVHDARGTARRGETQFVNAAVTDEDYELQHEPMTLSL